MKTVFIYALNCPITGRTRYVGKTSDPMKRFRGHLSDRKRNHRTNWVRSLLATGQKPVLEILDEVDAEFWPQWEVAYIQFFRESGFDLVNSGVGGESVEMTPETRAKISASKQNPSDETRAKMSASQTGKSHSAESKAKNSAASTGEKNPNFGKHHSAATLAKISAKSKGRIPSTETRAKMTASLLGFRHKKENTSSQFRGVCWHKTAKKWRATINVAKTQRHLGFFDSEIEAARAYDAAAKEHFGEFASPNFK